MKLKVIIVSVFILLASCSTITKTYQDRKPQAFGLDNTCDADPYSKRKSGTGPADFKFCETSEQLANSASDVCAQVECVDKTSGWAKFFDGRNLDHSCRMQVNDQAADKAKTIVGNKTYLFCQNGKYGSKTWSIRANAVLPSREEDQALANGIVPLPSVDMISCSNDLNFKNTLIKKSQKGEGRYYIDSFLDSKNRIYLSIAENDSIVAFQSSAQEKYEIVISKSRDQSQLKLTENLIFKPGSLVVQYPNREKYNEEQLQKLEKKLLELIQENNLKPAVVQHFDGTGPHAYMSECKFLKE